MAEYEGNNQVILLMNTIQSLKSKLDDFESLRISNAELGTAVLQRFLSESNDTIAISHGDTEWVLLSSVVVIMMTTPGIMLYYAGSVRVENVLATAMQGYSLACLITLLWVIIGYSLAFSPAEEGEHTSHHAPFLIGDGSRAWLSGIQQGGGHQAASIPETAFCIYQLAFAIITPVLISGAVVDRMKFTSLLVFLGLWHLLVYCPIAHAFWHPEGLMYKIGVLDFAGGNVVHSSAGISAIVSALVIGKRVGFGKRTFHPHNILVSITGACFLWIGWYGFNAGSAFGADGSAGIAFLNTQIASSSAALVWMFIEFIVNGQPSIMGLMNGSIAGLVTITPCSGFISPSGSFFVGLCGGLGCFYGVKIKNIFEFDDALDCFGIHAIGGFIGNLLVGCLAKNSIGGVDGAFYGNVHQLLKQIYGIMFTTLYSIVGTGVILLGISATIGLRLSQKEELSGMDRVVHNTNMYSQLSHANKPSMSSTQRRSQAVRESSPVVEIIEVDNFNHNTIRTPTSRSDGSSGNFFPNIK